MRNVLLIAGGAVLAALAAAPAMAQNAQNSQFLDETIRNEGLPRNAPSLGLSSIYGLNPCSSGVSVGVSTPLFGIAGASANIDRECETRNNAALASTALHDERLTREILCNIKDFRQAELRLHQPCLQDGGVIPAAATVPMRGPAAPSITVTPMQPGPGTGTGPVPQRYAPAMPQVVPPRSPGSPAAFDNRVPAFCRTPGLARNLYAECSPGSTAAQDAIRRQMQAEQETPAGQQHAGQPRVRSRLMIPVAHPKGSSSARSPVMVGETHAVALRRPEPVLVPAARVLAAAGATCTVPTALLALYPECNTGSRTVAPVELAQAPRHSPPAQLAARE